MSVRLGEETKIKCHIKKSNDVSLGWALFVSKNFPPFVGSSGLFLAREVADEVSRNSSVQKGQRFGPLFGLSKLLKDLQFNERRR